MPTQSATSDLATADSSEFVTPEGAAILLETAGYDLSLPWDASIRVRALRPYGGVPQGLGFRSFHVSYAGNYDTVIDRVLRGRVVQKVQGQEGHFLIAHSYVGQQGLAIWRGTWHEIATWFGPTTLTGAETLRFFEGLAFNDTSRGLLVTSLTPEAEVVETIDVSKHIPGVGFLDIKLASRSLSLVPGWMGAQVPTGEVWRVEQAVDSSTQPHVLLIHASPTTVTLLHGEAGMKAEPGPRIEFLHRLQSISWSRAASS